MITRIHRLENNGLRKHVESLLADEHPSPKSSLLKLSERNSLFSENACHSLETVIGAKMGIADKDDGFLPGKGDEEPFRALGIEV